MQNHKLPQDREIHRIHIMNMRTKKVTAIVCKSELEATMSYAKLISSPNKEWHFICCTPSLLMTHGPADDAISVGE